MATAAFSESAIGLAIRRTAEKLGYSKLRHQQVRAVKNFVQGNDVVVSLPTGSGKSLCYCILPATFDSLFGADGRHLARCIFPPDCDNQILYAFRVNYHYVTAYRADLKTLAGAPRRNSPRDYVWFTRLRVEVEHPPPVSARVDYENTCCCPEVGVIHENCFRETSKNVIPRKLCPSKIWRHTVSRLP